MGRSKFYNKIVTQKGNARVLQCMVEMISSRDHRYNTADPSMDHGKERVSSNRNQPCFCY